MTFNPARSPLPWAILLVAALAAVAAFSGLRDPDMFHHLAYGRAILRDGFFVEDPFLAPMRGSAMGVAPYWLGSVLIYLSWAAVGSVGPLLLAASAAAATASVILLAARRRCAEPQAVLLACVPIALAIAAWEPRLVPRTEIFGLFSLAATLLLIDRHLEGRPMALALFIPMAAAWANIHGSLLTGVAALLAVAASELLGRGWRVLRGDRSAHAWSEVTAPLLAALAGSGASLLTPSREGVIPGAVRFAAATVLGRGPEQSASSTSTVLALLNGNVPELSPISRAELLGPFGVLLAIAAVSFAFSWRARRLWELSLVGALVVMAFAARRYVPFAAVGAAFSSAQSLAGIWRLYGGRLTLRWPRVALPPLAAALAVLPILSFPPRHGASIDPERFPVRAVGYMKENGIDAGVYNVFHLGGFLEWTMGQPVFQDGRGALPPGDERGALFGPSNSRYFAPLDARYRFDALLLDHPGPPAWVPPRAFPRCASADCNVANRNTWALVAFDDGGALYLRRDGRYRALALRDGYAYLHPSNAPDALFGPATTPASARLEADRSLRESATCVRCAVAAAIARAATRDVAGANEALDALGERSEHPNVLWMRAQLGNYTTRSQAPRPSH